MGILIEQQAVIDCLTNTAKYYDMPQADEWTKGIHYGLLHGIDNILDNVKPVEAIPKDQYENRLKADLVAMLTEIQLEIEESENCGKAFHLGLQMASNIIQQKINDLPPVTPQPRKGHWMNKQRLFDSCSAECSSCHKRSNGYLHDNGFSLVSTYYDFCPKCGSDNREIDSQEKRGKK